MNKKTIKQSQAQKRRSQRIQKTNKTKSKSKRKQKTKQKQLNKKIEKQFGKNNQEDQKLISIKRRTRNSFKQQKKLKKQQEKQKQINYILQPNKNMRPNELSNNLFHKLYNSLTKLTAFLQIIQWKKKRQNCYSVRLSDGYYRIKVIAVSQAGKLLQKQCIQQFFIIQAVLQHQGQGVCLMSKINNFYQFGMTVGFTQPWKYNKTNNNALGSYIIEWQKWQKIKLFNNKQTIQCTQQLTIKMQIQNDNTMTMNNNKIKLNSSINLSTCKTQSISIPYPLKKSDSIDTILNEKKEIKQQNCQLDLLQQNSPNRVNLKTINEKKYIQKNIPKRQTQKSKRKLILSSQTSNNQDLKIQFNLNKKTNLQKDQQIQKNQQYKTQNQLDNSWENFMNDFVIFKKSQKTQSPFKTPENKNLQNYQIKQYVSKSKRQILQQLFESSSDNQSEYPQSHGRKIKQNKQFIKHSQTYSPQILKPKLRYSQLFDDLLQSQQITSYFKQQNKKIQYKEQNKFNKIQIDQKINLKWISKQLSIMKRQQKQNKVQCKVKSILQELMQDSFSDNENKFQQQILQNKVTKNNLTQNLIYIFEDQTSNQDIYVQNLNKKIFELKDLIQDKDIQTFYLNKNINQSTQWWLQIKMLFIQKDQDQQNVPINSKILPLYGNKEIKKLYLKCVASSKNNQFMCTLMLPKQLKIKYSIQENQIYHIKIPKIIENQNQQNSYSNKPLNMYSQWIKIRNQTDSIIKIDSKKIIQYSNQQIWINSIHQIQNKKEGDIINIFGFIKSFKQNKINVNQNNQNFGDVSSNSKSVNTVQKISKKVNNIKIMTIIEIVDPFTNNVINFTDFTINQNFFMETYMAISIFLCRVNLYKGQKCLISKPDTIIKIDNSFINTKIGTKFQNYLIANKQNFKQIIDNIQIQLNGYKQCINISHVCSLPQNSKVKIQCQTISTKQKKYLGCLKCAKKIYQNKCFSCGELQKQQIVQKVFLMGLIGDITGSIKFYLNDQVFQNYKKYICRKNNHNQQIEIESINVKENYNPWKKRKNQFNLDLKKVQVWGTTQNNQKPFIIEKIRLINNQKFIQNFFNQFSQI